MLILLSSSKRRRYREDILRCLAAPAGTQVQFRYSEGLVEQRIRDNPGEFLFQEAVVCSIDLDVTNGPCTLIPVRRVRIESILHQGSTVAVVLEMGDFAFASDPLALTSEVDAGRQVPRWENGRAPAKLNGKFFFATSGAVGGLKMGATVALWERVVAQLNGQSGYKEEQFFWTVLGMGPGTLSLSETLIRWNPQMDLDTDYTLGVYIFHPLKDDWTPKRSLLRLTSEPEVQTSLPHDTVVDSPYDVKTWRFQIPLELVRKNRGGWLRIGSSTDRGQGVPPEADWEIDLPLQIRFPAARFLGETVLVGLLISVPGITGILLQDKPSATIKVIASIFAVIISLVAAYVARAGIRKVV